MDAEGTALAHDAIQQHVCRLGNPIIFDEEFLEFIDHDETPRHAHVRVALPKSRQVENARLPKQLSATFQLLVDAFKHAQTKLTVAFDGDDARVRQAMSRIALELNALLK